MITARAIRTVLIAALTLLSLPAAAEGAFPGQNGKIAFDRSGGPPEARTFCIYIANADASGQAPLLPCDSQDETKPRWSPDGSQIAYQGGVEHFGLVNADGSNLRSFFYDAGVPITGHGWSPDGARLVVSSAFCGKSDCEGKIESVDAATSANFTILSSSPLDVFSDTDWSPDGSRIVFTRTTQLSELTVNIQLYLIRPDGTGLTPLTAGSPGHSFEPSWAPSGDKIAFVTNRDGNREIYVMNADGTGQTRLTTNPAIDKSPAWSPDGTKILFESWRDGNGEIYVMNADGSGQTNLTSSAPHEHNPNWQPIPGPRRSDYKNGSHFCKAERAFLGTDAFATRYGGGANAHGRCVSG